MLSPKRRLELASAIGRHLQSEYTFRQLISLLKGYGAYSGEPDVNSKAIYAERQLEAVDDDLLSRIASDYGLSPKIENLPPDDSVVRLWRGHGFRVFISHATKYKRGAHALSDELNKFAILTFVSHDRLDPGREWQAQIEMAPKTMNALVIVCTEEAVQSKWCDQEVGWALGAGVPVVPVKVTVDPHGFVSRFQAVPGYKTSKEQIALEVACILVENETTRDGAWFVATRLIDFACELADPNQFWRVVEAVTAGPTRLGEAWFARIAARAATPEMPQKPGSHSQLVNYLKEIGRADLAEEVDVIWF